MAENDHSPQITCRVVQISKVRMNPYVRLLQEALSDAGIACSTVDGLSPRLASLWSGTVDVLHLHWLELLYASPRLSRRVRLLSAVLLGLVWAKAGGCKVVYTVHNLNPHEQAFSLLDRIAHRTLFTLADALHVHDEDAALEVKRNCGRRGGVYVIPHGSYVGAYPNDCTREEARERLGLPNSSFVYLFLGQIRRYKGIDDLVDAFGRLGDAESRLVIAGNVHDPEYGADLIRLTQGRAGIHTWFKYVADDQLQYFMSASDVYVLPYRDVTTSGAAALGLSFGKPIVAPALSGFRGWAANGRGILYDPSEREGLLDALAEARHLDMAEAGERAFAWATAHTWQALAPDFVRLYGDILHSGN
jgi:beta-1,4-mannosyltransferase